jgi:hypothetical protein
VKKFIMYNFLGITWESSGNTGTIGRDERNGMAERTKEIKACRIIK